MSDLKTIETSLEPFDPVWWAPNAHIHTIVPSQFFSVEKPNHQQVEIPTPDNDFLEVDVCVQDTDKPLVALFHGLEGSTDRYYIGNLMKELNMAGFSSAAMNFRGCGSRMNKQPRFYHSGETQDYRTFFRWISETYPHKEIYAVGFSLGGNALVKYLGEEGYKSQVTRAAAVSPPFDLKEGSLRMNEGFNRIYEINFLHTLLRKLERKRAEMPMPAFTGSTIYEFDDQVTAPLHGFEDADDYYHRCSSKHFYKSVETDLLIIHSKEDPLCPFEFAPLDDMEKNSFIQTHFTEEGGHVGFLSSPEGWLYRVLIQWLDY